MGELGTLGRARRAGGVDECGRIRGVALLERCRHVRVGGREQRLERLTDSRLRRTGGFHDVQVLDVRGDCLGGLLGRAGPADQRPGLRVAQLESNFGL
jgi:hypothetical protein